MTAVTPAAGITGAALALLVIVLPAVAQAAPAERNAVNSLIDEIIADTSRTRHYTGIAELSAPVLHAMRTVPRERFVPDAVSPYAYENRPLSIGYGQTISQPYIVALMTQLLEPEPTHRVLEIGTGSGYQAAVLSGLVQDVYTIEIVPELAEAAAARLEDLGYPNVHVRAGDGWHGWPEAGPFDGIIVTAVAEQIPPKLLEQLTVGGRIVIPLGPQHGAQQLVVARRTADGVDQRDVLPVQFVPFTRGRN